MHKSVATIDSPQFINLSPLEINPMMSKCEIKVLYIGENRNRSYISKDAATEMAKTLRGAPIVGYYREDREDFEEHSEKITIDGDGVHFECLTVPYGFVSPDANVWFKTFTDTDEFGNEIEREYLMTTGYLWTGQFKECERVLTQGNNQSMELDSETLDGHWSENYNTGVEFFIINDAVFSKLCILGEDVEPCFEGASITAPDVSTTFSKSEDDFKVTLFSMMKELKEALQGGEKMANLNEEKVENEFSAVEEEPAVEVEPEVEVETEEEIPAEEETVEVEVEPEEEPVAEEFAKEEDKTEKEESEEKEDTTDGEKEDSEDEEEKKEDKKDENYSLLSEEFENLKSEYAKLESEVKELREFKLGVEREEKKALIATFNMLDDEDKSEFLNNIDKYSKEEIKKELAVICFDKKVSFSAESEEPEQASTTFNMDNIVNNDLPDWVKAVKENESNL